MKLWHRIRNLAPSVGVWCIQYSARRTILPDFTPIWFETMEPQVF